MDPITIIGAAGTLLKLGEELYQFVSGERARLQQTGEWTDAQEEAFLALQVQRQAQPWQKPMDTPPVAPIVPPVTGN